MITLLQALVAILVPSAFADRLTEVDFQQELAMNRQLAAAGAAVQAQHRADLRQATIERARLLRRALSRSFATLASAVILAILLDWILRARMAFWATASRDMSVGSVALFVWATLGRMGWKGQTIKGDTTMERADEFVFRALYWLGTFSGVLALKWSTG